MLVGQTHAQMPFMTGHAQLAPADFDFLVDERRWDYDLFCPPNPSVGTSEHAIALYVSALVRDGGTLQVGIGELGDALVYALLLRHQQNEAWRGALAALGTGTLSALIASERGRCALQRRIVRQHRNVHRTALGAVSRRYPAAARV